MRQDDHVLVGRISKQALDRDGAALERKPLVDITLVGDLAGVDRGRVLEQQHAGNPLGGPSMRRVPILERGADRVPQLRIARPFARALRVPAGGALRAAGRIGRVGDWRAGLGRCLCSPLARPFVCECHKISTMPRFQPPPHR